MGSDGLARQRENPFYILGLPTSCTRMEVEREGQKLLGMLELGLEEAKRCATPLGLQPRTAEQVRAAMAELRDPRRRLMHELWARLPADAGPAGEDLRGSAGWSGALARLGWTPR